MLDVPVLILSDLIMFTLIAILILYLVHRDTVRQNIVEKRYDSIISCFIKDVTKSQSMYKQEIMDQAKELNTAVAKVLIGVDKIVSEVEKVTEDVDVVSKNIETCMTMRNSCSYITSMNELIGELQNITTELKEIESTIKRRQ
jgi:hypothetical protein